MAQERGFPHIGTLGTQLAISTANPSLVRLENRHEIRNPDAAQPLRQLPDALRGNVSGHAGLIDPLTRESGTRIVEKNTASTVGRTR
jgi:hypothetical protein